MIRHSSLCLNRFFQRVLWHGFCFPCFLGLSGIFLLHCFYRCRHSCLCLRRVLRKCLLHKFLSYMLCFLLFLERGHLYGLLGFLCCPSKVLLHRFFWLRRYLHEAGLCLLSFIMSKLLQILCRFFWRQSFFF